MLWGLGLVLGWQKLLAVTAFGCRFGYLRAWWIYGLGFAGFVLLSMGRRVLGMFGESETAGFGPSVEPRVSQDCFSSLFWCLEGAGGGGASSFMGTSDNTGFQAR